MPLVDLAAVMAMAAAETDNPAAVAKAVPAADINPAKQEVVILTDDDFYFYYVTGY